jgi:hypothetical protein
MTSEDDPPRAPRGTAEESPSSTAVIAQWARGWEQRLRDEAVARHDAAGSPAEAVKKSPAVTLAT